LKRLTDAAKLGVVMIRNTAGIILLVATLLSALTHVAEVRAGTKYDGPWSVVVYTSSGPCDASNRFSGQIVNGEISYAYGSLEVTGHVDESGTTIVRVTYGSARGEAHGHMTPTQGSGTWSGDGPNGRCAGTWIATRPGAS
jgi:hypothetical protein